MTTLRTPWVARSRNWCAMKGSPATGSNDFGTREVRGPSRVAKPPARRARVGVPLMRESAFISDQLFQGSVDCFPAAEAGLPAQRTEFASIQPHHRHIALPAPIASRVFEDRLVAQIETFHGYVSDLSYG